MSDGVIYALAKGPTAVAAIRQAVVGFYRCSTLVDKDITRFPMVAQEIEDAIVHAVTAATEGIAFIVLGDLVDGRVNE